MTFFDLGKTWLVKKKWFFSQFILKIAYSRFSISCMRNQLNEMNIIKSIATNSNRHIPSCCSVLISGTELYSFLASKCILPLPPRFKQSLRSLAGKFPPVDAGRSSSSSSSSRRQWGFSYLPERSSYYVHHSQYIAQERMFCLNSQAAAWVRKRSNFGSGSDSPSLNRTRIDKCN